MDPAHNSSPSSASQNDQYMADLQSKISKLQQDKEAKEAQDIQALQSVRQNGNGTPPNPFGFSVENTTHTFPASKPTPQTVSSPAPAKSKEHEAQADGNHAETVQYKEIGAELETASEVEPWVKSVPDPKTLTLPEPIKDDFGEILIKASQVPKPKIVLPLDRDGMEKALHHKVADSVRWLYEWCRRLLLASPHRVTYKQ